MVEKRQLGVQQYRQLEEMLKFKNEDIRRNAITLLAKQSGDALVDSTKRLLDASKEEIRTGGLDLILQVKKESSGTESYKQLVKLAEDLNEASPKEKILQEEICGTGQAEAVVREKGYGLYDPDKVLAVPKMAWDEKLLKDYLRPTEKEVKEMFDKLTAWIEEHKNLEYKNAYGDERLLGNGLGPTTNDPEIPYEDRYPFKELWIEFYEKEIRDYRRLLWLRLAVENDAASLHRQEVYDRYQKEIFGPVLYQNPISAKVSGSNYSIRNTYENILSILNAIYKDSLAARSLGKAAALYVIQKLPEEARWYERKVEQRYYSSNTKIAFINNFKIGKLLMPIRNWSNDELLEGKQDLLKRYEYLQQFLKESRKFGAQRRASEASAVDMAMKNLATNAGYQDVMRLKLSMETEFIKAYAHFFEWKAVGDVEIRVEVDAAGRSEILCQKQGKMLKSLPAALKKDEYVTEIKEFHKKLKDQYSRAVKMFEQAMEDREIFTYGELVNLMENPVVKPVVTKLVYIGAGDVHDEVSMGFLSSDGLIQPSGKVLPLSVDAGICVAHPVDLYGQGHWSEYQQYLFAPDADGNMMKQPFKQVFRELYVKLPEELDKYRSMMFAGNQIQPQKTVGCLKGRRWIADYEDGLQKVYYKENIVARIYCLADWFSPADVEAPTLEWVEFFDRKTFKSIVIKDVPDIVYSEVMRDVDLAVSVAHAGGVDPETSHSTVEMRRAIVEFNLPLFGLTNVKLDGSHAIIDGSRGQYSIHLGSGVIHQLGGSQIQVLPVHSQQRGKLFLPFMDEDPKTAEIMSKVVLFARDEKIKDPYILSQIG